VLGADFTDEGDRYRHREVLASMVAEWCGQRTGAQVREALGATRILWSPYRSFRDLVADDARLLRAHPLFSTVDQPGVGTLVAPGSPITVDRRRGTPRPAPGVGQHTHQVLSDDLGLTASQLADLASRGLLREPARPDQEEVA